MNLHLSNVKKELCQSSPPPTDIAIESTTQMHSIVGRALHCLELSVPLSPPPTDIPQMSANESIK